MSTTVAQILKAKPNSGRTIYTVTKTDLVYDAIKLMSDKGIGALLVMDGDNIAGIVTERDYARKVVLQDRSSKATRVEEIMTTKVRYVEPSQTSDQCMALMTEHRMRHLPVLDDGKLIGLVSIGDLVKSVIADQQFTISQLEHYIHGTPAVTST
ncbi:CBS domain-containing protein [Burkholderia multivorans]|uniref:Inosine-5-monophosphate dehydrogenase n=1 Tax=Burkholderia multivorans TaxID=87883 RepID=A0A8E2RX62_9BURK|nr:CBS domain-containing protein [Burkholderia multivorans]MBU9427885.1 CBS domain-containing protein [Burkholderia multivorans]MCA8259644.1 CBS domain-containing protein [Burkholderia multivorans]MCL4627356.1 CBS domain-containing protein [Burkholderia multivorans]MCO1358008.1 CBS domain-containing protein [Burkholderia multivorans]MCO1384324.1 CBS domain-containing protein [Burkholderia multivorans]